MRYVAYLARNKPAVYSTYFIANVLTHPTFDMLGAQIAVIHPPQDLA